jgi:hypothetical protein
MEKSALMASLSAGTLTAEQEAYLSEAVDTHQQVEEARRRLGAFDWQGLLTTILPVILGLFTGGAGGALIPIINLILNIFKLKPLPVPAPTPTPSGVVPPTPVP